VFGDSEFRPADEVLGGPGGLDLDYLQTHGSASSSVSHLARQSLYVKFDPLIGGRPSVQGRPGLARASKQQSSSDLIRLDLLNSPAGQPLPASLVDMYSESLEEEMKTREAEFQDGFDERERNLQELRNDLNKKIEESTQLKAEIEDKLSAQNEMSRVIVKYEETIKVLIQEQADQQVNCEAEILQINFAKDHAMTDLKKVEAAFAEVHYKYEKTKSVVEDFKKNEDQLSAYIKRYNDKISRCTILYETLKAHASNKLTEANLEIQNILNSQASEERKMSAMMKKTDMIKLNLLESYENKCKENSELITICDELTRN
jgi:chromosome segregation ATPase